MQSRICMRTFTCNYDEKLEKKLKVFDLKINMVFGEFKTELQGMRTDDGTGRSEVRDLTEKVQEMEESLNFQAQLVEDKEESTPNVLCKQMEELEVLKKQVFETRNS